MPGHHLKRLALRLHIPEIHVLIFILPHPALRSLLHIRLTVRPYETFVLQVGVVQGNLCAKVPVSASHKSENPLRRCFTRRKRQRVAEGGTKVSWNDGKAVASVSSYTA